MLGILTGLQQEAVLIRRVFPNAPIALSYASEKGAVAGMERLRQAGVTKVLSFGCAGGLCPSINPGAVIVADYVHSDGKNYATDTILNKNFEGKKSIKGGILYSSTIVKQAYMKHRLYQDTGCLAVDMESGIIARSGLPFSVLRVVCDSSETNLPPAVEEGMQGGRVCIPALLYSILCHPGQIPSLIRLGGEAAKARQKMAEFLKEAHSSLCMIK